MDNKIIILVVEDNQLENQLICNVLKKLGYDTLSAYNGLEALEVLHKNRKGFGLWSSKISCIILDWNMPKMTGMEFIKTLRKKERLNTFRRFMPVIISTAYDETEKRDLAACDIEGMAAGYLTKPFDEKELSDLLNKIINKNETEILRDNFRESRYKRSTIDEFYPNREAFFTGNNDKLAEKYLMMKISQAEKEYKEALFSEKADESRLEFLVKVKDMYTEQLNKL